MLAPAEFVFWSCLGIGLYPYAGYPLCVALLRAIRPRPVRAAPILPRVTVVISAYNRGKVFHRFANTTDVVATIEDILGLGRMSQFDNYGRPLREIWESTPDLAPYVALRSSIPLDQKNPPRGALAEASKKLALDRVDMADEDLFNRILWRSIKGSTPYPARTRMSALEAKAAR